MKENKKFRNKIAEIINQEFALHTGTATSFYVADKILVLLIQNKYRFPVDCYKAEIPDVYVEKECVNCYGRGYVEEHGHDYTCPVCKNIGKVRRRATIEDVDIRALIYHRKELINFIKSLQLLGGKAIKNILGDCNTKIFQNEDIVTPDGGRLVID